MLISPDFLQKTRRHSFLLAIVLVVGVTLCLTTFSMVWYVTSGTSGLDLSRPGLVKERTNVKKDEVPDFSATGPIDRETYEQFVKLYDKEYKNERNLGKFSETPMSDQSLGLEKPAETSE